jgi:hypothetical protein
MPDLSKPGAVLFAKNVSRVAKFYVGVAGLSATHSDGDVTVLESGSQQLVIHRVPDRIAKTIEISSPPKLRENAVAKLIFPVTSIAEARRTAGALGGELKPKNKEFEARGFRACDGHDPEGNVIQFRELLG